MTTKRIIMFLLAVILFTLCASVQAQTDLQAIVLANTIDAVRAVHSATGQHLTYYDPQTGEIVTSADVYTIDDSALGVAHIYIYPDGGAFIWGYGGGYGRHGENGQLYVVGCIGDFYEEKLRQIGAQNLGEFAENQTIIAQEVVADGRLLITTAGPIAEGNASYDSSLWGETLIVRYTLDPETLIIISGEAFIRGADGTEKPYLKSALTIDPKIVLPFDLAALKDPVERREVRVIMEPGTDTETERLLYAPRNVTMYIYAPDDYRLYSDAACTVPYSGPAADENGAYPETHTVYCVHP